MFEELSGNPRLGMGFNFDVALNDTSLKKVLNIREERRWVLRIRNRR
jgi:hypothetical protein